MSIHYVLRFEQANKLLLEHPGKFKFGRVYVRRSESWRVADSTVSLQDLATGGYFVVNVESDEQARSLELALAETPEPK